MTSYFNADMFRFLKELKQNNNREWFLANKQRYENSLRNPFLRFISDLAPHLKKINPYFVADPRPHGGSLFRIYRDIRFSEDKSPYKTHAGANFPHAKAGKEVHVPGYYLHIEPNASFAAAGIWHPDARTLGLVRSAILNTPDGWKKVRRKVEIQGDVLKRPPKGFSSDHPLIEDLKRKDFVTSVRFQDRQVTGVNFLPEFVSACKQMTPLMQFLTRAVGLPW